MLGGNQLKLKICQVI